MLLVCAVILLMVTGCWKTDDSIQEITVVTTMSTEAKEENVMVEDQDVPKDTEIPNTEPTMHISITTDTGNNNVNEPANTEEIQSTSMDTLQPKETTPPVQNPPITDYGTITPDDEF